MARNTVWGVLFCVILFSGCKKNSDPKPTLPVLTNTSKNIQTKFFENDIEKYGFRFAFIVDKKPIVLLSPSTYTISEPQDRTKLQLQPLKIDLYFQRAYFVANAFIYEKMDPQEVPNEWKTVHLMNFSHLMNSSEVACTSRLENFSRIGWITLMENSLDENFSEEFLRYKIWEKSVFMEAGFLSSCKLEYLDNSYEFKFMKPNQIGYFSFLWARPVSLPPPHILLKDKEIDKRLKQELQEEAESIPYPDDNRPYGKLLDEEEVGVGCGVDVTSFGNGKFFVVTGRCSEGGEEWLHMFRLWKMEDGQRKVILHQWEDIDVQLIGDLNNDGLFEVVLKIENHKKWLIKYELYEIENDNNLKKIMHMVAPHHGVD